MKASSCALLIGWLVAAALPAQEGAAALDCQTSFELGKAMAKRTPAPKWFWPSFAAGALVELGCLTYDVYLTEGDETSAAPTVVGCSTLGLSILLPLLTHPEASALPARQAVDPECYRRGFARRRRLRNARASVLGFTAGMAVGYAIFTVMGFLDFMLSVE